ncbi:MAG: TolC family protein [Planctomycetes bacterium]|nr:TolC family protein [Planctomycetota bacterium]
MSTTRALPLVAALLAALPGCGPSRAGDNPPAPSVGPIAAVRPEPAAAQAEDDVLAGGTVTTPQALAIAHRHHPTHALFAANRRAVAAHVLQAQAWDNPEGEIELGRATTNDGERRGVGRLSVRQRIPWPGKRSARTNAAQAEGAVAESEARNVELELAGEVTAAVIDIAIDHQALAQARAAQAIAREVLGVVERRLAAGEATKADALRARVESLQADQAAMAFQSDLAASRASLNALCGGVLPEVFTAAVALDNLPVTSLEAAHATAENQHPQFLRLQAILRLRQCEVERERAAAYPDVTLGAFSGRETDSRAVGLTLGMDIPLWNRNQGGIESAFAEIARTQADLAVQQAKVFREVDGAWRDYEKARILAERYAGELRPVSKEALRLALGSYQAGETSLLDLLDARRTAQGVESALLDAVRQAHAARIRLDLATGSFAELSAGTTP